MKADARASFPAHHRRAPRAVTCANACAHTSTSPGGITLLAGSERAPSTTQGSPTRLPELVVRTSQQLTTKIADRDVDRVEGCIELSVGRAIRQHRGRSSTRYVVGTHSSIASRAASAEPAAASCARAGSLRRLRAAIPAIVATAVGESFPDATMRLRGQGRGPRGPSTSRDPPRDQGRRPAHPSSGRWSGRRGPAGRPQS